ncbi:MAG: CHAP domain-containing protein [Candidatus Limnocylindrales bacterium]
MKISLQLDVLDEVSAQLSGTASHHEDLAGGLQQRARSVQDRGGSSWVADQVRAAASILAGHGPTLRAQSADLRNRVTVARSATADSSLGLAGQRIALAGVWATGVGGGALLSATLSQQARSAAVQAFIAEWKGNKVDFDKNGDYQCMDLAEQYNREVVHGGATDAPKLGGDAADPWDRATTPAGYQKVPWTKGAVPSPGDLVIWKRNEANGNHGHIALFSSGNASEFTTLDQNWGLPQGSGYVYPPTLVHHNITATYEQATRTWSSDVYGWLRPIAIAGTAGSAGSTVSAPSVDLGSAPIAGSSGTLQPKS